MIFFGESEGPPRKSAVLPWKRTWSTLRTGCFRKGKKRAKLPRSALQPELPRLTCSNQASGLRSMGGELLATLSRRLEPHLHSRCEINPSNNRPFFDSQQTSVIMTRIYSNFFHMDLNNEDLVYIIISGQVLKYASTMHNQESSCSPLKLPSNLGIYTLAPRWKEICGTKFGVEFPRGWFCRRISWKAHIISCIIQV